MVRWFKGRRSAESSLSETCVVERGLLNVEIVFKVLQSGAAGKGLPERRHTIFHQVHCFPVTSLCCGSQKQQVRDAQIGMHNCNTFRNICLTPINSSILWHDVTIAAVPATLPKEKLARKWVKEWLCRPTLNLSIYEIVFSLFAKSECRIQIIKHIWTETCVFVKIS